MELRKKVFPGKLLEPGSWLGIKISQNHEKPWDRNEKPEKIWKKQAIHCIIKNEYLLTSWMRHNRQVRGRYGYVFF